VLDFSVAQRPDQRQVEFTNDRVRGGETVEHAVVGDDFLIAG